MNKEIKVVLKIIVNGKFDIDDDEVMTKTMSELLNRKKGIKSVISAKRTGMPQIIKGDNLA